MRICIPTETNEGLKAKISIHFGSTPYFTIFDTEKETVEAISNINQHHMHGMCHPMRVLSDKKIDVVVCSGMGARAIQRLNESGIKAYRAIAGTIADIIREYQGKRLQEITFENACIQHGCH